MSPAAAVARRPAMKRRIEPLVWLMFSGGGVLAAVFLPVLVFLFALRVPARTGSPRRTTSTWPRSSATR